MNDRLHVASILLGHLITGDQGKDLRARLAEVRHCIGLADLLIGLCETSAPTSTALVVADNGDADSDADKEADRSPLLTQSMSKQIYERRRARLQPRRPGNGPTLH